MPVRPNFLERLVLFRLNRGPPAMIDLFDAASFEAVTLALDVGLFETLADADDGLTVPVLADRLDADERGLERFLAYLAVHGYVAESGGRYRNTAATERWLLETAETNLGPWLTFWAELVFPFWEQYFETAVREGEPPRTLYEWCDEEPARWELAQRGFRAAASVLVDEVAKKVTVPDGASRLLDVGGGHGLYAVELCRRDPGLSATVFDTPEALGVAREEARAAGLADRVRTEGGDYLSDGLGEGYDMALVFNVVHAHDAVDNVALFERVADALAPGGRIAVLDQLEGSSLSPVGRTGIRFVDLTYLVTLGAETHHYDEVADWLRRAGFRDVERTRLRRAPGNELVQATTSG